MKKLTVSALSLITLAAPAFADKAPVTDEQVQNYMRSSLYTIILNSETMNKFYEEETMKGDGGNEFMAIIKEVANTDAKKAANETETGSLFSLPARVFASIEIPKQFNDHNLQWRVVNFDSIRATVTDAELAKWPSQKKKSKTAMFGKLAKSAAGMSTQGNENNELFDNYSNAVVNKFFVSNNVAPSLIAKWYDYNPKGAERWGLGTVLDRGSYNFSKEDLANAAKDISLRNKIDQTAFDMISNTYVLAVNLRFRSYQAIVAETSAAINGLAGGGSNSAVSMLAAGASAAAGDGYTVQAVSSLYRLKWNEDLNQRFATEIFEKKASLEDLVKAGICELEYVGTQKASSNIRQSVLSDKPISSLVKRATARAIDESIIKLQNSHEEFRTVLPILGGDGENIYAAIGTKEGLNEKDEYEILEANEDANGHRTYKAVGTVKAVKGKIMNNAYGAEDDLADGKISDEDKEAINRSYSEFKGKKGDYTGYYLRLKKKK